MDSNKVADLLLAVWVNDTPLDNDNRQTRVKQKCDSTHTEPSEQVTAPGGFFCPHGGTETDEENPEDQGLLSGWHQREPAAPLSPASIG